MSMENMASAGLAEPMIDHPAGLTDRLGSLASRVGDFARDTASNIGDAIHTGYEYVADHYDSLKFGAKTLTAIGGIAFVGAQAAELSANAEPVMAGTGNTPEAATPGATASTVNLRKKCIQQGLREPTVPFAQLTHPGKHNQEFLSHIVYYPMQKCVGQYLRSSFLRVEMQDAHNPDHWIDLARKKWQKMFAGDIVPPSIPGSDPSNLMDNKILLRPNDPWARKVYFHRTPGPAVTHVRELIKNVMRDENGKKIGERIYKVPAEVFAPRSKQ